MSGRVQRQRGRGPKRITARTFAWLEATHNHGVPAPIPAELQTARAIGRWGVPAVMGREMLTYKEIRAFTLSEMLERVYVDWKKASNWVEWADTHPDESKFLATAREKWQTQYK